MAPDFERLARMPWPMASLASSGISDFELGFCLFVFHISRSGLSKDAGKFGPGV